MTFFSKVHFPPSETKINHFDNILTLGSCFAASMTNYFKDRAFPIQSNPNGIIYHPLVIAKNLERIAFGEKFELEELMKNNNDLWHSWDHHGSYSHPKKETALEKINTDFEAVQHALRNKDWLIFTFGTAYGYRLKSNKKLVANCHKYPSNKFYKELAEIDNLLVTYIDLFRRLKKLNSKLKIILTVSPIRHKKDGFIENNRSKSRLLILTEKLEKEFDYCQYFPSYEYLMDELRDYRFYKKDLLHPSAQAEDFIWEKFSATYFNKATIDINTTLMKFQKAAAHRPLFPDMPINKSIQEQKAAELLAFAKGTDINVSALIKKFQR